MQNNNTHAAGDGALTSIARITKAMEADGFEPARVHELQSTALRKVANYIEILRHEIRELKHDRESGTKSIDTTLDRYSPY